ncbi:pseudouridine synthase [Neisseria sp. 23W00296]|uniref:pseudouridine synthase n=1 Tax=unclassified Neisseria TaxID=2623750 RepID=UPI0003453841
MSTGEPVRLSKRMAELGLCSRREADGYIERGWVKVNGAAAVLGQKVTAADRIDLAKEAHEAQAQRVTILLNKPVGYVSGQPEKGYRAAAELITPENHWEGDTCRIAFNPAHLRGLAPAGRLDIDSVGLLVLTQDGRTAKSLIGDNSGTEKEYLVRVKGRLNEQGLALLNHGLGLDGERLRPAKVEWQNEDQLRFVLKQGKKRQIRRMCELVGLRVVGLKRIRIGRVKLGALPPGKWRYLHPGERF